MKWVIKAWQAIPTETVANLLKACGLSLPIDGSKDDMISCFKEGNKCVDGRALLQAQLQNTNERSLHENLFEVMEEDVTEAAPS